MLNVCAYVPGEEEGLCARGRFGRGEPGEAYINAV